MKLQKNNCYVITGGPGVGKTTLLNELAKHKFKIVHESAREIIKQEIDNNGDGLPWKNKAHYTALMLEATLQSYNSVPKNETEIYFFDRGIIDTICYANMIGLGVSTNMDALGKNYLYNKRVFILPPWKEIYQTDNERKQTWEEAQLTFIKMKEAYLNYGYKLIEVPQETVQNRVKFIMNFMTS
ncbi:MAG: ATPase [Pedobacter sp.]|nr:MAG: ATPase [Pedobacter sp.]